LSLLHPAQKLTVQQQKFDELSFRLNNNLHQFKTRLTQKKEQYDQRLLLQSPLSKIQRSQQNVNTLHLRLMSAMQTHNTNKQNQFKFTIERLNLVSPLATIARGYSVTKSAEGKIITSIEKTQVGDNISIQLADGDIAAKITNVNQSKK
jgi:exodeoxyribonuclease VII large subunit